MSNRLRLSGIRLGLEASGRVLLEIDDLLVSGGEVVTVMGASGSGKSSLLSYICGVLSEGFFSEGRIYLSGVDITHAPSYLRGCGIVFQSGLLFPHLTVFENLGFGLSASVRGSERLERISWALDFAGLSGYGDCYESTLSGGEKARIALLRVILSNPSVLLLDEPFSSLDAPLRKSFREFTLSCSESLDLPVLLVTHDIEDSVAFGGKVLEIGN